MGIIKLFFVFLNMAFTTRAWYHVQFWNIWQSHHRTLNCKTDVGQTTCHKTYAQHLIKTMNPN